MRTVTCQTAGCDNYQVPIEVLDDGMKVVCGGGCGNTLAEQADWFSPPFEDEPDAPTAESVAEQLLHMSEEERANLVALLQGTPPQRAERSKE